MENSMEIPLKIKNRANPTPGHISGEKQIWKNTCTPMFTTALFTIVKTWKQLYPINRWMLLLSRFSHVWLCTTPEMAAHQAPPSLGYSRQEHWSGLPFPSPMHESKKWKWSHSVVSNSERPQGLQPTRLLRPWDFPGKSTGVGCHCLLQTDE